MLVSAGGRTELVASGAEAVVAYDPATGNELWRTVGTRSHPIPSFVSGHGLVFATAGSQAKVAFAIRPGPNGDVDGSRRRGPKRHAQCEKGNWRRAKSRDKLLHLEFSRETGEVILTGSAAVRQLVDAALVHSP